MIKKITQKQIDDYQKDGAICIRGLLTEAEIALLKKGIEYHLKNLSPLAKIASSPLDPGLFIEDFCNWQANPYYKDFIFTSAIGEIAAALMDSRFARLYHDHLLVKEPGTQQHTPWHQDQPYYNIAGRQTCSLWIPIDPVTRASTLEFIAGSHTGTWYMPRSFMSKEAKWFREGTLKELPDIDRNRKDFPILGWEMQPGDVVCFHMLTIHAAGGVDEHHRRRVFSVRFIGEDVTHSPRSWVTSPPFTGLLQELPAGQEMEHPLFPIVWQKN